VPDLRGQITIRRSFDHKCKYIVRAGGEPAVSRRIDIEIKLDAELLKAAAADPTSNLSLAGASLNWFYGNIAFMHIMRFRLLRTSCPTAATMIVVPFFRRSYVLLKAKGAAFQRLQVPVAVFSFIRC
jgi:hypothetical protein